MLLAAIVLVAGALVLWQDWWTPPLLAVGLLVNALDRRGATAVTALGIAAASGGSLLALGVGLFLLVVSAISSHVACGGPNPCPTGPDGTIVLALALIGVGICGLIASTWWMVRAWRSSPRIAARPRDIQ